MINIGGLTDGVVIDHIHAGGAMEIYQYLMLDKTENEVALIQNAKSRKMGRKDIIKIEGLEEFNFDMLAVFDNSITIDVIRGGEIVEKRKLNMPEHVVNIIRCKNPRCITSTEQGLVHRFKLTNREKGVYRCEYCEQSFRQEVK